MTGGINRRGFVASLAGALAGAAAFEHDPERALWVPGAKLISVPAPPAIEPRWKRPFLEVGEVITFGRDPQRYIVMQSGHPQTGLGATFAFLDAPRAVFPMLPALDERLRPPYLVKADPWALRRAAARRLP